MLIITIDRIFYLGYNVISTCRTGVLITLLIVDRGSLYGIKCWFYNQRWEKQ